MVLRAAKAKNREENDSQKKKTDSKARAFTEAFGQIDAENYADNEIHEWDKHQNDPPCGPTDNLAPNVKVVDWDDACPTWVAGFDKHLPHRYDHHKSNEQCDNRCERAWSRTLRAVAVIDLSEQARRREQSGLRNFDE